jgi:AraC family transcriptional regulator
MNGIIPVKNMVCNRCVMALTGILNDADIPFEKVILGEIHLERLLSAQELGTLGAKARTIGFELIDTKASSIIEKIKKLVIQKARNETDEDMARLKLSTFLSDNLHHEYSYLSNLFSSVESRTIENYFIEQRIEYVKELLVYGELTLSEIAYKLDYSSTAHISSQFKKVTGLTPSHYKKIGAEKRKSLDQI